MRAGIQELNPGSLSAKVTHCAGRGNPCCSSPTGTRVSLSPARSRGTGKHRPACGFLFPQEAGGGERNLSGNEGAEGERKGEKRRGNSSWLNYCLLEITLGCVSARCCVCLTAGVLTLSSARLVKSDVEIGVSIRHPGESEGDVRLRTGLKPGLPESEPAGLWDGEQERVWK